MEDKRIAEPDSNEDNNIKWASEELVHFWSALKSCKMNDYYNISWLIMCINLVKCIICISFTLYDTVYQCHYISIDICLLMFCFFFSISCYWLPDFIFHYYSLSNKCFLLSFPFLFFLNTIASVLLFCLFFLLEKYFINHLGLTFRIKEPSLMLNMDLKYNHSYFEANY